VQDWSIYPHARFVSEYGWQSYPSWSTYAAATAEEDWQVTADMTEYRCALLWTLLAYLASGASSWDCVVVPLCAGGCKLSQQAVTPATS
jgi:hypothetical protein